MRHAKRLGILAALCVMSIACGPRETAVRSANDFCLNDRRISIAPAAEPMGDDPGNALDSEQTVGEVLEHNAVHDRLCPSANR